MCFLCLYSIIPHSFFSFDCCLLFSICVFISLCVASVALAALSSCLGCIPPLIGLPFLRFMRLPLVCSYCLCDFVCVFYIIIINDTLARSLEPVVTECKEHTIHTQTQIVASRKPKEIKHTHEGEANFT